MHRMQIRVTAILLLFAAFWTDANGSSYYSVGGSVIDLGGISDPGTLPEPISASDFPFTPDLNISTLATYLGAKVV